jgi:translocation and assembly module TamB
MMPAPRIIGKIHVDGATLRYGDFPTGLSNLAGDFNFDTTRILFENVTAESGGGNLNIGGTMSYGNGSVNYTVNARSDQVRIRYPEGMSWLVAGKLRFSGKARRRGSIGRIRV